MVIPRIYCCFAYVEFNLANSKLYNKTLQELEQQWEREHPAEPDACRIQEEDDKSGSADCILDKTKPKFSKTVPIYIEGEPPEKLSNGKYKIFKGTTAWILIPDDMYLRELFVRIPCPPSGYLPIEEISNFELPDYSEAALIPPEHVASRFPLSLQRWEVFPLTFQIGNATGFFYRPVYHATTNPSVLYPANQARMALWARLREGKKAFIYDCYVIDPNYHRTTDGFWYSRSAVVYAHRALRIYGSTTGQYGPFIPQPVHCLCDGGMIVVGSAPGGTIKGRSDLPVFQQQHAMLRVYVHEDIVVDNFRFRIWFNLTRDRDEPFDLEEFCEEEPGPIYWAQPLWKEICQFRVVEGRAQNLDAGSIAKRVRWLRPQYIINASGTVIDTPELRPNIAGTPWGTPYANDTYLVLLSNVVSEIPEDERTKYSAAYVSPYGPYFPNEREDNDGYWNPEIQNRKQGFIFGQATLNATFINGRYTTGAKRPWPDETFPVNVNDSGFLSSGTFGPQGFIGTQIQTNHHPKVFRGNLLLQRSPCSLIIPALNCFAGGADGLFHPEHSPYPGTLWYLVIFTSFFLPDRNAVFGTFQGSFSFDEETWCLGTVYTIHSTSTEPFSSYGAGAHIAWWSCLDSSFNYPIYPKLTLSNYDVWWQFRTSTIPHRVTCYIWDRNRAVDLNDALNNGHVHFRLYTDDIYTHDASRMIPDPNSKCQFQVMYRTLFGRHPYTTYWVRPYWEYYQRPGSVYPTASADIAAEAYQNEYADSTIQVVGGFTGLAVPGLGYSVPLFPASTRLSLTEFLTTYAQGLTLPSPADPWTAPPQYWGFEYNVTWRVESI